MRDAAIALDAMTGYGTPDFVGEAPDGGYAALLGSTSLEGKRIGTLGPGFRANITLSDTYTQLYAEALAAIEGLGATVVLDPFAGSVFAELAEFKPDYGIRQPRPGVAAARLSTCSCRRSACRRSTTLRRASA